MCHLLYIFFSVDSQSIMSSSPLVSFHEAARQAHSAQPKIAAAASLCVKTIVFVLLICSLCCTGKHSYGLA